MSENKTTKVVMKSFATYRNRAFWKNIKAGTFEDAMAKLVKEITRLKDRSNYYEIKNSEGKLTPVL